MNRAVTSFALLTVLTLMGTTATAQELDAQNFQPAVGPHSMWATEGARTVDAPVTGGLLMNYGSRPIVIVEETDDGDELITPVADQQFAVHGLIGFGIANRLQLDIDVPLYLVNEGDLPVPYNQIDIGDIRLRVKARILGEEEGFGLGIAADLGLPTGAESRYVGAPSVVFAPRAIVDYDFGPLLLAFNTGVRIREEGQFGANVDLGPALTFGLGGEYEAMEGLLLITADVFGKTHLRDAFAVEDTPVEALVGAKVVASHGIAISAAAGGGIVPGMGAPEFRTIVGITWAPRDVDFDEDGIVNDEDACPDEPEDKDGYEDADGCPEEDNDADGIADEDDSCPVSPEDIDGFEDEDGCPDPDNDGDGIMDDADECPDEAEDADGFEDLDGCPDPDNDGDGILDDADMCPGDAEDLDGYLDNDGCPDPDNDRDKIPDVEDACPDEAGLEEDRGCPPAETKAVREKDQIKILDKVYFETGEAKIKEESFGLLKQVALILRTNDDITKVEIGGHTDYRGNDRKNLELSQARANAVRTWLVEYGVSEGRLSAVGYGEEMPIAEGRSKDANAQNRRVEFKILGQGGDATDQTTDEADEADEAPAESSGETSATKSAPAEGAKAPEDNSDATGDVAEPFEPAADAKKPARDQAAPPKDVESGPASE